MKVTIGNIQRTKLPVSYTDYIVIGVIAKCNSSFYKTPLVLRSEYDMRNYFDEDSSTYAEIKALVETGVTVVVLNAFTDIKQYHSWMTPTLDGLIIPSYQSDSKSLEVLKSPIDFSGETYVVKIYYNPSEVPIEGNFYINLPSGYQPDNVDNEFVSSLSFHTGTFPDYADNYNDVYDGVLSGANLGEIFDDLKSYFLLESEHPGIGTYITRYLSKDAENDKVNGVFTVYYNQPLKYLPKTIHPESLRISYNYFDNLEYLQDYVPNGTVTFQSKLLGDCSKLRISHKDGLLKIILGDLYEEYEVSGSRTSGKFIGDVKSRLVGITVNAESDEDITIPEFDEYFHPVGDMYEAEIDINATISKLLNSDFKVNAILLSDSLIDFDLSQIDLSVLDRELIFASINNDINQLKQDYENVIKFSGKLNGLPTYIQFVKSLYDCVFGDVLDGVPELPEGINLSVYDVWYPKSEEFYNYLDTHQLSSFVRELGLPLEKITIYHLFYIMALSIFILRYKLELLFVEPGTTIAKLRSLIHTFTSKFSIFDSVDIEESQIEGNKVSVTLSTKVSNILKYKEILLNFKLEF